MTTVHTLASGSAGNAVLISWAEGYLLVDAGISCRRITRNLEALGLTLGDICALLITHTHTDHVSGLKTLLKRTDIPVYAAEAAGRDLVLRLPEAGIFPLSGDIGRFLLGG